MNPRIKSWAGQGAAVIAVAFLASRAGFDMPFRLVEWDSSYPYGWAPYVSGVNTLLASALIVVLASVLGLALMRLSGNPLAAGTSRAIIEVVRNTPQLVQIVFVYVAVLQVLPPMRQSLIWFGSIFLNARGLHLPSPSGAAYDWIITATVVIVIAAAILWRRLGLIAVPRLVVLPPILVLGAVIAGFTANWDTPALKGFNIVGGTRVPPELLALVLGIGIYTSVFIAEIIRAAIEGIHRGQSEAPRSLGLTANQSMFLVVLPQALRLSIPGIVNIAVDLFKDTTLVSIVGLFDLMGVVNQSMKDPAWLGLAAEGYTFAAIVFFFACLVISLGGSLLERRFGVAHHR